MTMSFIYTNPPNHHRFDTFDAAVRETIYFLVPMAQW